MPHARPRCCRLQAHGLPRWDPPSLLLPLPLAAWQLGAASEADGGLLLAAGAVSGDVRSFQYRLDGGGPRAALASAGVLGAGTAPPWAAMCMGVQRGARAVGAVQRVPAPRPFAAAAHAPDRHAPCRRRARGVSWPFVSPVAKSVNVPAAGRVWALSAPPARGLVALPPQAAFAGVPPCALLLATGAPGALWVRARGRKLGVRACLTIAPRGCALQALLASPQRPTAAARRAIVAASVELERCRALEASTAALHARNTAEAAAQRAPQPLLRRGGLPVRDEGGGDRVRGGFVVQRSAQLLKPLPLPLHRALAAADLDAMHTPASAPTRPCA